MAARRTCLTLLFVAFLRIHAFAALPRACGGFRIWWLRSLADAVRECRSLAAARSPALRTGLTPPRAGTNAGYGGAVTVAAAFAASLRLWEPPDAAQAALRDEYVAFVDDRGEAAASRSGGPEHLTASCFVFSPDLGRVLLCFHGKGRFWVQLGGHIEPGDASVADAALREACEESGLRDIRLLTDAPADLNRHELAAAFGACHAHHDVGFVAVASADAPLTVSAESDDVRWFAVDALPDDAPANIPARVAYARARAWHVTVAG